MMRMVPSTRRQLSSPAIVATRNIASSTPTSAAPSVGRTIPAVPPDQPYAAYFVPPEIDAERAIALGVKWLVEQPGERLILLHAKKMIDNNRLLSRAARQYGLQYEAPNTVWKSRWTGGPILAPWASETVIRSIEDDLAHQATAVCVIGSRNDDPNHQAWVVARDAISLETGERLGKSLDEIAIDPVVRIALDDAERFVNHNNQLVQYDDKAYLVRTLQELVRGGHRLDLDAIGAYALATGWSAEEVKRIREYGQQILDGRGFRLRSPVGPKAGTCRHWEREAADGA